MKILITTQIVDPKSPMLGFFTSWIEEFAKHFSEVHVICLQEGSHDLPDNVYVYSLGKEEGASRLKYTFRFYKYFWRIFFRVKVDYVFFHMGAVYNIMAAPFFLFRKLLGTKFYWWKTHGQLVLKDRTARFFVDVICTAINESFPIDTPKKKVIGHAIDTELFTKGVTKRESNTILFTGRFSRSKRLEQVVEITKRLRSEGTAVTTECIGPVTDQAYFAEINKLVEAENLTEAITFIPGLPQPELVERYRQTRVFINPSDNDGLDKVILEAMLCGAVPLTGNSSFKYVLSEYDLFLQKGDIDGYVERVKRIFTMSDADYNELTEKLRADVIAKHSLDTLMDRIFSEQN